MNSILIVLFILLFISVVFNLFNFNRLSNTIKSINYAFEDIGKAIQQLQAFTKIREKIQQDDKCDCDECKNHNDIGFRKPK